MKMMFSVVLLLLFIFCGSCALTPGSKKQEDNRVILVAIDRSRSMHHNDPARLAIYGAQLALAVAPRASQVGVVTYSDTLKELVPLAVFSAKGQRERAHRRISEVSLEGVGNLYAAITGLRKLLEKSGAKKGACLIIFSDGKCSEDELAKISGDLIRFKGNDWRIHTVALTPKDSIPLFASISQSTGGEHFKIEKPQELVYAISRIAAQEGNLFTLLGHTGSITVVPGTERLLLVAMRNSASEGFDNTFTVKQDSGKVTQVRKSDRSVIAFPQQDACDLGFESLNIWEPLTGVWSFGVSPQTGQVQVYANLPLLVTLHGLKDSFLEGEPVDIQFSLSTEQKDLFAIIKKSGECSVSISGDNVPINATSRLSAKFEAAKSEGGVWRCTYTGRTCLFLKEPGKPQNFLLALTFTVTCPDGSVWLHKKEARFELNPGLPPIVCQPERVNFGSYWTDLAAELITQELLFSTTVPAGVNVYLASEVPPQLFVSDRDFKLSGAGEPVRVNLLLNVTKSVALGANEENLAFAAKTSETGCFSRGFVLPVTFAAYRFSGSDVEMRGYPGETVKSSLNFSVQPQIGLSFKIDKLSGPRDLLATITGEGAGQGLEVAIPSDALDGDYIGELEILPSVEGLAPRKQRVILRIKSSPKLLLEPERIYLRAEKNGWIETSVEMTLQHFEDVQISFQQSALINKEVGAKISSEFDTELLPEKGWDGMSLSPATSKKVVLRFMVSSDLPAAKYEGKLTVKATSRSENITSAELPVILEVSR